MDSILNTIKKKLNVDISDTSFDTDIITDINTALMRVSRLGIGPSTGFYITDDAKQWIDLLGDRKDLEGVKTYIYLKVRLMFDPPANQSLLKSINEQISELESELASQAELPSLLTTTTTTTTDTTVVW
jgi:hypothetical protein